MPRRTASPSSSTWARSTATRRRRPRTASSSPTTCSAQSKTNPKVKALLDKVRLIDMPVVNADGHVPQPPRAAAARRDRPARHVPTTTGVDLNRNYPFGWGSNIGVSLAARGSGPGSEPEVKNTMEIVQNNQVVTPGHAAHELARDLLPGHGDLRRPDARPQQRLPRPRAGDGPRHGRRLHQRPRLGARLRDQRRDQSTGPTTRPAASATRSSSSAPARAARRRCRPTRSARRPTTPAPPARARPPRRPHASRATRSATRSG